MAFQRKKPAAIGVKAPYPGFIEPALATSIDKVPNGERWIHEIKFDGYRVQAHLVNEAVKVFTRRGNDWTKRFKKVADESWHIARAPRSSTARLWSRPPTAPRISRCCRMNSRASQPRSSLFDFLLQPY
jgi:ATP dependent DNA ligase domain